MTDDPYRTPGDVVTDDEQRRRWRAELDMLSALNAHGRSPEELAKMQRRAAELRRRLGVLSPAEERAVDAVRDFLFADIRSRGVL